MASFEQRLRKLYRLDAELDKSVRYLSKIIENKLGDGWGITPQTDGICLVDIHSDNYCLPVDVILHIMDLPREEAMRIVKRYEI